ncbi:MAG: hypothetical protein J1G05_06685 [Clostridiales bacterium]|nr:hypothetical protein [Clostridiales bacterium]
MSKSFKISIAAAIVHILSALAALTFFLILKLGASGMEAVPFLIIFAFFIAMFAGVGIVIFVIQFSCAVGIIVTGIFKKEKLCALFCGLPLLADLFAAFFAAIFGFTLITGGLTATGISIAIALLLLAVLSLAGIVLSIIAMVKNLSKKHTSEDENR